MFPEYLFFVSTVLFSCLVEYAMTINSSTLSMNSYGCLKNVQFFNTYVDIKLFIYMMIIIANNMITTMYFICILHFTVALFDYLKLCLNGTVEMSRESAHSLYCMIWLTIYFYTTNVNSSAHLMTILAVMTRINLIERV